MKIPLINSFRSDFVLYAISIIGILSCQNFEPDQDSVILESTNDDISFFLEENGIDQLLQTIDTIFDLLNHQEALKEGITKTSEPQLASFEIIVDSVTGEVAMINFELDGFFPIVGFDESIEDEFNSRTLGNSYTVWCTKGDKTLWTKKCSSSWGCGKLTKNCFDEGGCAHACKDGSIRLYNSNDDFRNLSAIGLPFSVIKRITPSTLTVSRISSGNWNNIRSTTLIRFY